MGLRPAVIDLPGTSVPEHVINCRKYSTVLHVIKIVELGDSSDLPALLWSSKNRKANGWSSKDDDIFLNLMTIYFCIHDHKHEWSINNKVERTRWRGMVIAFTSEFSSVANYKYSVLSLSMHCNLVKS